MATRKKSLGKGLDALLGGAKAPAPDKPASEQGELRHLPVEQLQPGKYQPRTGMDPDKLTELADSIRAQGVVQPIVARPIGNNRYEIIAGERRWRAAQQAELRKVPVVVRAVPDQATVAMALIENIQREDLNPLEESGALKRLIEEFGLTHTDAARAVGRSRASVSNLLRLQELDPAVKALVDERRLEMGHARALLSLSSSQQISAARQVVEKSLSVRETEALVRRMLAGPESSTPQKPSRDPDIVRLEQKLTDKLGARVKVKHSSSGKGQVSIDYSSLDELDGILGRIR